VAIILGGLILLGAIGAAVYFLVLKKDKPAPPPWPTTETSARTTRATETEPTETEPEETEPEPPELSVFASQVLALDPYEAQHLGANPVYYYQHPDLDIAIDLRGEEEAAGMMFVYPTPKGFTVTHRQAIAYEYGSLRDYPAGMDVAAISVTIDLLSESEAQAEDADIIARRLEGEEIEVERVRVKDGILYVRDNMSGGPDSAWYARELYGTPVFFDHRYLSQHLVESVGPGPQVQEARRDSEAEWQSIVSLLHSNPAEFEWRYHMPPYSEDPNAGFNQPNFDFVADLITVPIYEYGELDLNGDGYMEYLIHCCCDSYDYIERYGYWAVFTETPYGLRLIGFYNTGENDLIYADNHLYSLMARGNQNDFSLTVEEIGFPVASYDLRPVDYTAFTNVTELINYEAEGGDISYWKDWTIVPRSFTDDEGFEYSDYYVIDTADFWGLIVLLDQGLSDKATVISHRTPYTVPPGETVVELLAAQRMGNFVDYLNQIYHYFPFAEEDWMNAITLESVMDLGPPLTYDKVESLFPHPELLWP